MANELDVAINLDALERHVADAALTLLDAHQARHGDVDRRWHVMVNTDIEHDL